MCEGCVQEGSISRRVYRLIEAFHMWAARNDQPDPDEGMGHIVFADDNVEDHHLDFCLTEQQERIRPLTDAEREFLELLRMIPQDVRVPNFWQDREDNMNITNVSPMGPRVLVKRLDAQPLTSQLIEVVQMDAEPSQFAVVLAVGALKQGGIEIGDTIVTKPHSGAALEVIVEGAPMEAFMLVESDCLAVIE